MKGLAGVVILYNPDAKVYANILSYSHVMEKIWVIDNSENNLQDLANCFPDQFHIEVIQDGENKGIGARINIAIDFAIKERYDWLLMMDQDSRFTKSNLDAYLQIIREIKPGNNIAQIGVSFNVEEKDADKNISLQEVPNLITSGSCINLKAVSAIGKLNEEMFIDEVDYEFSYRAYVNKWKNMQCVGIYLLHTLGERKMVRSLKDGKMYNRGIHSPIRLYYITRNYLWVRKKYYSELKEHFKLRNKQMVHVYKNNILYSSHRITVIKMIIKGYFDYKKNKLGKLNIRK